MTRNARQGASMALAAMVFVQLGLAASMGVIDEVGPATSAWLRLAWAAVLIILIVRPSPRSFSRRALPIGFLLGLSTAGLTGLFLAAMERLPLGTASAIEFLGPLGVAICRGHGRTRLWAVLAAFGVFCLTEPWAGRVDPTGVAYAAAAAFCWAAYIVLTQRVGDELDGLHGLAISLPVAALTMTVVMGPSHISGLSPRLVIVGLALALLLPIIPFSLELLSLRRLTTGAFGTLMALEPGIALIMGLLFLAQVPSPLASFGVACVVVAGLGAARGGSREDRALGVPGDFGADPESPDLSRTSI